MKTFLLSPLFLAITLGAVTQTTSAEEDLERILVTGSRIAESIDEVPASVTIISKAEIEDYLSVSSDLQNLLARFVPGIAAANGTSSNFAQTLRGRAALVMIDGVPQSTPLRNGALGIRTIDPSMIERIEVIKGATSVYGNGAAGGIINYITKRPTEGDKFTLSTDISTRFSAVEFEDSQGHKVTTTAAGNIDQFDYTVSIGLERNGVLKDAEGDALGTQYGLTEADSKNYFVKLGYQINDDQDIVFSYNYFESQQNSDWVDVIGNINLGEKTYATKSPEKKPSIIAPQGPRGNHNYMLKYTHGNVFTNTELAVDVYKQTIENVFFYSPVLANPDLNLAGGQSLIKSDKQGIRSVFNTRFDLDNTEATLIYGLDLLNDVTSQPMVDGRMWVPEMDMNNTAGFIQSKWVIDQDLAIKAGIRHEQMDIAVDDYSTLKLCRSAEQCSVPMAVKGGDIDFDATTYNIGVRYNRWDAFSPFISYTEGANVADLGGLLRSAQVNDISLIHSEAAIIDNVEVGFRSEFDALSFEFSRFKSTSNLGSRNQFDPKTGIYITVRAPQKIWGYEGVLNYRLSDTVTATATYSYVEGKHTETDKYIGGRQISAPKGTIGVNWALNDRSNLNMHYLYVGSRKRFEPNDEGMYVGDEAPISSYSLVNINGHYDFDDWTLYAGIENLFNKDYFPARSQALTFKAFNIKGLGRNINMGVKFKF